MKDDAGPDTVADLDMQVADRQAIGVSYARPADVTTERDRYKAGALKFAVHPAWHGEATDWLADPFNDRNWRFQHHTLRWLNPLRWAALDGDAWARDEWVRVVRSWAGANIPASRAEADFAWTDMVDGNRAIQFSLGARLVDPAATWFVDLLEYHRDWLLDERHIVGKNHGLHQHMGLLVVAALLRDQAALETATTRMRDQFATTFDTQGCNDEGSASYHQLNMRWWSDAWQRARLEGIDTPAVVRTRLEAASNVLAHIALPDGELPQIGDGARVAVRNKLGAQSTFVFSRGQQGRAPEALTTVLDRGYVASRSGWGTDRALAEESHALIRHGPELRSHSHRDRGSLHLYSDGQRWLVDSGFHSYQTSAPESRHLHSRAAHNVALVPGVAHEADAPVDLVHTEVTAHAHDFVLHDRGYRDFRMTRRVIYLTGPDCWLVMDEAEGAGSAALQQRWHVEPGLRTRLLDRGFKLVADGRALSMQWIGPAPRLNHRTATHGSLEGWIGVAWKKMKRGAVLTATSQGPASRVAALISPYRDEPLGVVASRVSVNGNVLLDLVRGGSRWRTAITEGELEVTSLSAEPS